MDFIPENQDYRAFTAVMGPEIYWEAGNYNLFMMCEKPEAAAFRPLAAGFTFRLVRPEELELWKAAAVEAPFIPDVSAYFNRVYAGRQEEFFRQAYFLCDGSGRPSATGLLWKAWGKVSSLGWIRTLPAYEGRGIGRMLLSALLERAEYPLFLHTQPTSARAIKLYSDFGFRLLTDPVVGERENDLQKSLPLLQRVLPEGDFAALRTAGAPEWFLEAARSGPSEL